MSGHLYTKTSTQARSDTCTPVMRVNEGGEWWEKSDEEIEQSNALSDI